jgi:hypothetical protein
VEGKAWRVGPHLGTLQAAATKLFLTPLSPNSELYLINTSIQKLLSTHTDRITKTKQRCHQQEEEEVVVAAGVEGLSIRREER